MDKLFSVLNELKVMLDQKRPLPAAVAKNLHESLVVDWAHHSNAIEGNSLTLKETKVVLEGIAVGGKTLREHFEVINNSDAIELLEVLASDAHTLNEWHIKTLHQLLRKNIDHDNEGEYRQSSLVQLGVMPAEITNIRLLMRNFIQWYQGEAQSLHPVERAALIHCEFIKISPFDSSNGLIARLLMNLELLKAGFPATVITLSQAPDYFKALDTAHSTGDTKPLTMLIANSVIESFKTHFWALGMTAEVALND